MKILCERIDQYKDALIVSPTSYDSTNNLSFNGGPLIENQEILKGIKSRRRYLCRKSPWSMYAFLEQVILKINNLYFDENFFLYFSDDDLCRRILILKNLLYRYMMQFVYMSMG